MSIIFYPLFSLITSFVLPILGKSFTWPCKSSHWKPFSEWKLEASFRILHLCRTEFIFTGFSNLYYRKKHNLSSSEWCVTAATYLLLLCVEYVTEVWACWEDTGTRSAIAPSIVSVLSTWHFVLRRKSLVSTEPCRLSSYIPWIFVCRVCYWWELWGHQAEAGTKSVTGFSVASVLSTWLSLLRRKLLVSTEPCCLSIYSFLMNLSSTRVSYFVHLFLP